MFSKKMEYIFAAIALAGILFLGVNTYNNYRFHAKPISSAIQMKIDAKEQEITKRIYEHYGISFQVPLIISDNMPSNLYGVATLEIHGNIKIYINKKRIKESLDYILDDVLAHEYAHALMFLNGNINRKDGHTKMWQEICSNLGGSRCDRYVNHNDIVLGKMKF